MNHIKNIYRCDCGTTIPVRRRTPSIKLTCPKCEKKLSPGSPVRQKERGALSLPGTPSRSVPCPFCAENVPPKTAVCPHCDEALKKRRNTLPKKEYVKKMQKRGNTALLLGVAGFLLCTILSPLAWFYSYQKEKECRQLRIPVPGNMRAGTILGMIGSFLFLAYLSVQIVAAIIYYRMGGM